MLPNPNDPTFPDALKIARESRNMSYTQIAKLCNISPVMPSRYENRQHGNFCSPSDKTWLKLNTVLYGENTMNSIEKSTQNTLGRKFLDEASAEELIRALKDLGATTVTVSF